MVCVEDHLEHAAAHFPRNGDLLRPESVAHLAGKCIPTRRRRIPDPDIPYSIVRFTVRSRCTRKLSFQTSRRLTVRVANPVQSSALRQSLAGPRIDSLPLLDRHPSYTIGEEGHQQEYQPW